ncbi:hypothetical protein MDUV_48300 [Mycolicibacterium duvalii]|uniref:Uncharacterized protein n=1 Tax=Mycolicibacterium duvalii TaxID=39688 RepID=A0A7I7K707_9MYCO|nr:hypothetical protein MDUV_48300 [Mycolicibacterium duvalii]
MAGGTDSAEKKDSWLTLQTLGQRTRTDRLPGRALPGKEHPRGVRVDSAGVP